MLHFFWCPACGASYRFGPGFGEPKLFWCACGHILRVEKTEPLSQLITPPEGVFVDISGAMSPCFGCDRWFQQNELTLVEMPSYAPEKVNQQLQAAAMSARRTPNQQALLNTFQGKVPVVMVRLCLECQLVGASET